MKYKNKPNFLIVGAAKSGTTSLFNYLRQHKEIYLPDRKECGFFSEIFNRDFKGPGVDYVMRDPIFTFDEYMTKCFKNGEIKEKAVGEASTDYLYYYYSSIKNIKRFLGDDVKIIIILRNPMSAVISRYKHNLRRKWEVLTLEEAIVAEKDRIRDNWLWDFHYISSFSYSRQVEAYLSNFKNILVLLYDEFKKEPLKTIKRIFDFLGVDNSFKPDISVKYNVGGIPKYKLIYDFLTKENYFKAFLKNILPEKCLNILRKKKTILESYLLEDVRLDKKKLKKFLYPYFKNDIDRLEKLIQIDLSSWRTGL